MTAVASDYEEISRRKPSALAIGMGVGETCSASLTVKRTAKVMGLDAHDGEGVFRSLSRGHEEGLKLAIEEILINNFHHVANSTLVSCHYRSRSNIYGALYHHLTEHTQEL